MNSEIRSLRMRNEHSNWSRNVRKKNIRIERKEIRNVENRNDGIDMNFR
jgi:hypothetical protein